MHYVHIASCKRDPKELVKDEDYQPIEFCIGFEDLSIHKETILQEQVQESFQSPNLQLTIFLGKKTTKF